MAKKQNQSERYLSLLLAENEKIMCLGKTHWVVYLQTWIGSVILLGIGFASLATPYSWFVIVAFVGVILSWCLAKMLVASRTLLVTNQRIVVKSGIVARALFEIKLNQIEGINVLQGVKGRIFGYASLQVKGLGGNHQVITTIANYLDFKRAAQ